MHDKDATLPRLLLVEDDPISAGYMQAVLESLPAHVDTATHCADALARPLTYDLWLIDANLPDGSGSDLLARARQSHPSLRAFAHTADTTVALHAQLRDHGFIDVLVKPMSARSLLDPIRDALDLPKETELGEASRQVVPDWDDAIALRALHGRQQHVQQMRQLFLQELPTLRESIAAAARSGDVGSMRAVLHRLRASCGFVGAMRLSEAVERLHRAPESAAALEKFMAVSQALANRG